MWIVLPV